MDLIEPEHSLDDVRLFIKNNDDFYIFGTGFEAIRIKRGLESIGKRVRGFLSNCRNVHDIVDGLEVYPVREGIKQGKILVASLQEVNDDWEVQVSKHLIDAYGLIPFRDFAPLMGYFIAMEHYHRYKMLMGRDFYLYFIENKERFLQTIEILDDEYSKEIYRKVVSYKMRALEHHLLDVESMPCPLERYKDLIKKEDFYLKKITSLVPEIVRNNAARNLSMRPYSYFELVKPDGNSAIVDAGAFNGDTAVMFNYLSPDARVYCFEPVEDLHAKLLELKRNFGNIEPINLGLWNVKSVLEFNVLRRSNYIGVGSFIGEGADTISVIPLDDYVKDRKIKNIDFIKMDIEGAEMEALNGAENSIRKYHPDMAICIYHTVSHLWEIPLWIKSNFPEYHIYIDHKSIHPAETVCYASVSTK